MSDIFMAFSNSRKQGSILRHLNYHFGIVLIGLFGLFVIGTFLGSIIFLSQIAPILLEVLIVLVISYFIGLFIVEVHEGLLINR